MDNKTLDKGILYTYSTEVPCAKNHVCTGMHLMSSSRVALFQHITKYGVLCVCTEWSADEDVGCPSPAKPA